MGDDLWYLLAGTRGSENRARIVRTLDAEPRNANRLADRLELDYNTVRHHLDTLCDHGVVRRAGDGYGAVYQLTDRFEAHRSTYRQVLSVVDYDLPTTGDGVEPGDGGRTGDKGTGEPTEGPGTAPEACE